MRFREAMEQALYGPAGFFRTGQPAEHFRTSAHSPLFADAVARLILLADNALGQPSSLDVVDVGAGGGELLGFLRQRLPARIRLIPVEFGTPIPVIPAGVLLATEWLDNVPLDLAENGNYLWDGAPLSDVDKEWISRWWPSSSGPASSGVVEIGRSRDLAWASAVGQLRAGLALAVDYGHFLGTRPASPTVAGFRDGREVEPQYDGSTDLTVHVALDSVAAATGLDTRLLTQREALHWLGVSGTRPPLSLAHEDPARYVRELARASEAATLTDPAGLGGHWWLIQTVGCAL
jgi:SAM-dependent MidA family methyltransferase